MSLLAARRSLLLFSAVLVIAALSAGCFFGGGSGGGGSTGRPGSAPTATPPNPLPEPIDLGSPGTVGGEGTPTGSGEQTYTTQSGDTLLAIAVSVGVPAEEQAAWIAAFLELNSLPSAAALQAGVEYKLPPFTGAAPSGTPGAGATPTATPSPTTTQPIPTSTPGNQDPTPTPSVSGGGGTYTVVSGDYPLLIAEKLGVPPEERQAWVDALVALNGIDPSNLSVGQVLELPANTPGQASLTTPTPAP
jgi:LysM repeat protein